MKLHELGDQRPLQQAAQLLENQIGNRLDFSMLGPKRAQGLLSKVRGLLREERRRSDFHRSEKNAGYLQLMVLEQALQARIDEIDSPMVVDVNDPKTKATMQKAERGQTLSPDEQKTMNAIALTKKEGRKPKPMVREQSELQQAQVVLAAQDMIDRLQGMLEDISEMQFKDLPALADSIKNDMGVNEATQFQTAASQALTTLLQAVQSGKTEMEAAQGVLTGQAPQVPGADMDTDLDVGAVPAEGPDEEDVDLSIDTNIDSEEPASDQALGRERR